MLVGQGGHFGGQCTCWGQKLASKGGKSIHLSSLSTLLAQNLALEPFSTLRALKDGFCRFRGTPKHRCCFAKPDSRVKKNFWCLFFADGTFFTPSERSPVEAEAPVVASSPPLPMKNRQKSLLWQSRTAAKMQKAEARPSDFLHMPRRCQRAWVSRNVDLGSSKNPTPHPKVRQAGLSDPTAALPGIFGEP